MGVVFDKIWIGFAAYSDKIKDASFWFLENTLGESVHSETLRSSLKTNQNRWSSSLTFIKVFEK